MKLRKFHFKKVNSTNDTAIRIIKNSNNKFGMYYCKKSKKRKRTVWEKMDLL